MESIKRMRAAHEKIKNPATIAHPVSDESLELGEHEQTLAEILGDKTKHSRFFNSFLPSVDAALAAEVVNALADEHVLTDTQEKWLEKQRQAYNLRSFEVEKVREVLDEEGVDGLSHLNPKIALIVGKIGVEKAAKFLGDEFEELAFSDPKAFKKMTTGLRGLHDVRSRPSSLALERRFRDQLFSYGIAENEYFEKTAGGPTLHTKEELGKLAKAQYPLWKKAINFAIGGALEHRAGRKLYQTYEEQQQLLGELEKHEKVIGGVLAGTLNGDMRLAIQKAMLEGGEVKDKKEKDAVASISEYREAKDSTNPADVQKRFDKYADERNKAHAKKHKHSTISRDVLKEDFATQEYGRQAKYYKTRGLFALLTALFFRTKDEIKNALT